MLKASLQFSPFNWILYSKSCRKITHGILSGSLRIDQSMCIFILAETLWGFNSIMRNLWGEKEPAEKRYAETTYLHLLNCLSCAASLGSHFRSLSIHFCYQFLIIFVTPACHVGTGRHRRAQAGQGHRHRQDRGTGTGTGRQAGRHRQAQASTARHRQAQAGERIAVTDGSMRMDEEWCTRRMVG